MKHERRAIKVGEMTGGYRELKEGETKSVRGEKGGREDRRGWREEAETKRGRGEKGGWERREGEGGVSVYYSAPYGGVRVITL